MADQLDRAQQENDLHLAVQLKKRKHIAPVTGYCAWCAEKAPAKASFCDSDCRDDYEQDRRKRGL
jgi:hypothetical protein